MTRQWVQQIVGQPPAGTSREEYERIVTEAEARGQNVYFGTLPNPELDTAFVPAPRWADIGIAITTMVVVAVVLVVAGLR